MGRKLRERESRCTRSLTTYASGAHEIGLHTQVNAEYEAIVARIEKGNPAQVEEQLRANRAKVTARLSRQQTTSH